MRCSRDSLAAFHREERSEMVSMRTAARDLSNPVRASLPLTATGHGGSGSAAVRSSWSESFTRKIPTS